MLLNIKRITIVLITITAAFFIYVGLINIHSKNMTYRQKFLKAVYPVFMWFTKTSQKEKAAIENLNAKSVVSFYTLGAELNNGSILNFESLKGKKVLLVNTASDCGYTNQYDDLQKLSEKYNGQLVVIGFPANDFKEQEKGGDADIASFCKLNFGVSFPLAKKSSVKKGSQQNTVFNWLSDASKNGWNNKPPSWNFSKYLLNEKGELTNYFDPFISPLADNVIQAIEK